MIHPKTSGAALGTSLGVLIVAILHSVHGVHMSPELPAAITGFLAVLGSYLSPAGTTDAPGVTLPAPSTAPPVTEPVAPPTPPTA